jgi:hypothetical protein
MYVSTFSYAVFSKLVFSYGQENTLAIFICPYSLIKTLWGRTSPIFFSTFQKAYEAVEQIPEFFLFEVLFHGDSVLNFFREEVGEVFVINLRNKKVVTLTLPVLPHHPLGWYSCFRGRRRLSLFSKPFIEFVTSVSQVFISFYSGTSTVISSRSSLGIYL